MTRYLVLLILALVTGCGAADQTFELPPEEPVGVEQAGGQTGSGGASQAGGQGPASGGQETSGSQAGGASPVAAGGAPEPVNPETGGAEAAGGSEATGGSTGGTVAAGGAPQGGAPAAGGSGPVDPYQSPSPPYQLRAWPGTGGTAAAWTEAELERELLYNHPWCSVPAGSMGACGDSFEIFCGEGPLPQECWQGAGRAVCCDVSR